MTRLALLVAVLSAAPHPLASESVKTRQAAAVSWSGKHGAVKLPWPDALATGDAEADCVELRAPAPAACAKSVWACPVESQSAMCTGAFNAERRLVFVESDGPPSDQAFSTAHAAQGVGLLVRAESGNEHQKCIREAKARNARAALQLRCELLVVNPCLREAFVRCTGKNLGVEPEDPRPGVARVTWVVP